MSIDLSQQELTLLRGLAVESMSVAMTWSEPLEASARRLFDLGLICEHGSRCHLTEFGRVLACFCRKFRMDGGASISEGEWETLKTGNLP